MRCVGFKCKMCGFTEANLIHKLGDAPDFIMSDGFHSEVWHCTCKKCGQQDTIIVECKD